MRWRLNDPAVIVACDGGSHHVGRLRRARRRCGRRRRRRGRRRAGRRAASTARRPWSPYPATSRRMRVADPALAQQWRVAVREALSALVADGARITGFDRDGWYVVRRAPVSGVNVLKLTGIELRRVSMPLVSPFRTSFGTQTARELMLLRVVTDEGEGWGECVAMADPLYSSEYNDAAADVLRRFLVPALAASGPLDAHAVAQVLEPFKGHRMAKSALEMGVLDAELRAAGPLVRRRAGRRPRPGAVRRLGRDHGQHPGAARRGRRLPRRGLRPDQAQDRARLGRRAGACGPRDVRRRRAAAGRREHGVHAGRRASSSPSWTRSTCCSSSSRSRRRTCSATPTWRS